MAKTPGFGERVEAVLKARGYWKNATIDYARFGIEHGFHPNDVYRWWKGETPRALTLFRFAQALGVSVEHLLGVDQKKRANARRVAMGLLLTIGSVLTLTSASAGASAASEPPRGGIMSTWAWSIRARRRALQKWGVWLMASPRPPVYTPVAAV